MHASVSGGRLLSLYNANFFFGMQTAGTGEPLPKSNGVGGPLYVLPTVTGMRYRGFAHAPGELLAATDEGNGGVYLYNWNGTGWYLSAPIYQLPAAVPAAERNPVGVAISTTARVVYVSTAAGKIFGLDYVNRVWVNSGAAVYTAPPGSALRGMALAPVPPSSTATPSASTSSSQSVSATPSQTRNPDASPTSTSSITPSGTASASVTPPPSTTASSSATPTGTPLPTPSPANAFVLQGAQLAVVRVQSGVAATLASPAVIDVLSSAGSTQLTLQGSIPLPMLPPSDSSQYRLTLGGSDTRWGSLSRSGDGRLLVIGGIDAAPGGAVTGARRVIGTLSYTGAIDVSTSVNGTLGLTGIWAAASNDGSGFWSLLGSPNALERGIFYTQAGGNVGTMVSVAAL